MGLTLVSTLVVIGVLVFVHELGHFLAAKWAGVYVHRFSLGLGAPIRWLSFRRGETEYSVSWLPLGGYVKMASAMEDATGAIEGGAATTTEVPPDRVFEAKPIWTRMIVILAGVAMNILFAWVLFSGLVYFKGIPVLGTTTVASVDADRLPAGARRLADLTTGDRIEAVSGTPVSSWQQLQRVLLDAPGDTLMIQVAGRPPLVVGAETPEARAAVFAALRPLLPPVIESVVAGRPGEKAGLQAGDTILAIDGEPIRDWRAIVGRLEGKANQEVVLDIGRSTGRVTLRATPAPEEVADSAGVRTVGKLWMYGPSVPDVREAVGLGAALREGTRRTVFVAGQIVNLVRGMFSGRVSTRELGGPIAIGMAAGESVRMGIEAFLILMAGISVNLAVLNLLPIPILDGGQFLFLLAEAVTRRPVTGRVREWLTMAGLAAIVMLMVLAFSNDIRRLLGI
jgi:regulator of sigma E protease